AGLVGDVAGGVVETGPSSPTPSPQAAVNRTSVRNTAALDVIAGTSGRRGYIGRSPLVAVGRESPEPPRAGGGP
ncbi:MAG TPA: hypothetical protein VLS92_07910, partial [Acidimicrobiia bacterium]|nr:hypothetical protein [Acidimicrobiia bacterium]